MRDMMVPLGSKPISPHYTQHLQFWVLYCEGDNKEGIKKLRLQVMSYEECLEKMRMKPPP
jgi:hypothetical protein